MSIAKAGGRKTSLRRENYFWSKEDTKSISNELKHIKRGNNGIDRTLRHSSNLEFYFLSFGR